MPIGIYKHKLHSQETRKKMSESKKGKPFSEEHKKKLSEANKGKVSWNMGKKLSEETRKKISNSMKGEKSPNWKGGVSKENHIIRHSIEFRLWRESVFARDNWTCQKCKIKGGKLHSHHIKNFSQYPELRFAIDNGITLCKDCHKQFHKKYGTKKNNKKQLMKFLYHNG